MKLETVKDISSIISSIVLPVVIFLVGQSYTRQQAKAVEDRANFDRLAEVIKTFGSERQQERLEALNILNYYAVKCKFLNVILPALEEGIQNDDQSIADKAMIISLNSIKMCRDEYIAVAVSDSDTAALGKQIYTSHPVRVPVDFNQFSSAIIIKIQTEDQRQEAQMIKTALQDGFGVLIEKGQVGWIKGNVVRYFHENEKSQAIAIARRIDQVIRPGTAIEPLMSLATPPGYFEVCLPSSNGQPKRLSPRQPKQS